MSIEPINLEGSEGDTGDFAFDMIPQEQIRYVQDCAVSSGGFITESGGHEPAVFLRVKISKGPADDPENDEELVLALMPFVAHELSETMHYLSCPESDGDSD